MKNATGNPTPTGSVQFEVNGVEVGNPVALANGQTALTTPLNGNTGANNLVAFYQGDAAYAESVSTSIPITISNFALSSSGTTAAVGSAAIAPVAVNGANNYSAPISLTCTLPSTLTESACFVNPNSITGTGQVSLTVNSTPAHPLSSMKMNGPGLFAASGSASLACVFLLLFPRRRWRGKAVLALASIAFLFTAISCGSPTKTDPGTAPGNYSVVVVGTAGSGSTQYQSSVNVPITIH